MRNIDILLSVEDDRRSYCHIENIAIFSRVHECDCGGVIMPYIERGIIGKGILCNTKFILFRLHNSVGF